MSNAFKLHFASLFVLMKSFVSIRYGDLVTFNPHIHVLPADGLFRGDGVFVALLRFP